MTDFKSAAEQQVRETLGWWPVSIDGEYYFVFTNGILRPSDTSASDAEVQAYQALVSKTAELLEMTAQRDEARHRGNDVGFNCTICGSYIIGRYHMYAEAGTYAHEDCFQAARAESAEATIREQAERIATLEESLALTQSLSSQIWDAAEVAWKEEKTETEASNER